MGTENRSGIGWCPLGGWKVEQT